MIRRPPRSTLSSSSAASDVYKRQGINAEYGGFGSARMSQTDELQSLFQQLDEASAATALPICDQILQLAPNDTDALVAKATALIQNGADLGEVLALPDVAELAFPKAYALYKTKRYDECMAAGSGHAGEEQWDQLRAQLLYRTGRFEEASVLFEQMIPESEQDPEELRTNLIAAHAGMGGDQSADREDSGVYDVLYNVACVLVSCNMLEDAAAQLEVAISNAEDTLIAEGCSTDEVADETAGMRVQLGYVMQKQHQYEEAMSLYQEILKAKPTDAQVVSVAHNNMVAIKQHSELFDSFKKIKSAMDPTVLDKLTQQQCGVIEMNHATLLLYMNKTDACKDRIGLLEKQYGPTEEITLLKAAMFATEKRPDQAEKILTDYMAQHADATDRILLTIAQLQLTDGRTARAIETLGSSPLASRLGMVSTRVSLYDQIPGGEEPAGEMLQKALETSTDKKALLLQIAQFHDRHHQYQQAAAAYEELIALDSSDMHAVAGLVTACAQFEPSRAEKYAEAIPSLEAADLVDSEALEAQMVQQVPRDRRVKRNAGDAVDATTAAANDAAKAMELRRKEACRQKRLRSVRKRLPKKLDPADPSSWPALDLSLIHISEPTRLLSISYAVFCLKKKKKKNIKEKTRIMRRT
eukprot:TRINITY_DN3095_c0_g1_i2.p1 TRINITY_DN3095_c0_g1~~TRINITY_DN3095_c0_g1_i2.p1  ORF type:complete len:641 (+),score=147.63 TRINITY_DN3095_c0_g1_i2:143-2065(+)